VNVAGEDVALQEGDSMYFDSSALHTYRAQGRSACSAMVVVTPDLPAAQTASAPRRQVI
jgi:quercetin dioxygenase-like cupin family protein